MSILLDAQDQQNTGLHDQLDLLSNRSMITTEELTTAEQHVENLEKMAMEALSKNERYRDKTSRELWLCFLIRVLHVSLL